MIAALLGEMREQLNSAFGGTPSVGEGPAAAPPQGQGQLPRIVLGPGKLELPPPFGDSPPGQMRPREAADNFAVNTSSAAAVQGPYTLAQAPLEGTVSCRFNWNQAGDPLEGKKLRLYPRQNQQGDGFEINYATRQLRVFYAAALTGAPRLEVEYQYPAVFTLREFRQTAVLEAYAGTRTDAEKWAALAAAVLTTHTRTLLDEANSVAHRHSAGNYVSRSLYNAFHLLDGTPDRLSDSMFRYTFQFSVTGQVILERTFAESADVIRKIFSPGHKEDAGSINIEANLD